MARLRLAACQIDTWVGDLDGNVERILAAYRRAEEAGADIAAFPELAITGYPPEDLLLKPGFVTANLEALQQVAEATGDCVAIVGFVDLARDLHNAAAVCAGGEVRGVYHKCDLPNYGVFDELRYFGRGQEPATLWSVKGVPIGVSICEDIWNPRGPTADQADSGAEVVVNINASPYAEGKLARRERMLATRAADASTALLYVNQVGGQDELVFDGGSMAFGPDGTLLARSPQFVEDVLVVDVEIGPVYRKRLLDPRGRPVDEQLPLIEVTPVPVVGGDVETHPEPIAPAVAPPMHPDDEVWEALVVGTRAYVEKNGFSDVVIGLSGGLDSSIVAVLAADALGADRVHTVAMPSRYSSDHSVADAAKLAANLGTDHRTIPIEPAHAAVTEMLSESFAGLDEDLTEENLQSRIRGQVLMALSNKLGWLVLSTSNKSEAAVGYATLYGDTVGGYALIKDVLKLRVFQLCRRRNERAGYDLIPENVLTKPPSAELRPDQTDDQSLPPYEVLDPILDAYVEHDRTPGEIIAAGHDPEVVRRITRLVDGAEYKRRQSPPGPRVTDKAFGKDRRLPITNAFRG
ncbi:NAD+ synthase [Iamia sp. SCSIO 61187]|uniref:NAD+ synthase n=1 Tax=Iamia sp. SCSIO 61187 TaxID=2722752 RepID=UPI001C63371C|nr:NAD+ synthase [Iamia sp. SCSIO 61187]QYG94681.1 NAD+ synthase [Iamia sp. SCSIO 61187]